MSWPAHIRTHRPFFATEAFYDAMDSFILRAPPWRPPTRASAAGEAPLTDFPDLYATHPTQEEDQLTESNVMRGFTGKPVVTVRPAKSP